jgi:SAM-dependent methyltransferase
MLLLKKSGLMKKKSVKTWSTPVADEERRPIPCVLCGAGHFKPRLECEGFAYVRCARCGLVQMNPQPLFRAIASRYQEGHGTDYLSYELANEANFLRLQELALRDAGFDGIEAALKRRIAEVAQRERMAVQGGQPARMQSGLPVQPKVLDIGCATGALLARLRDRGWACTGVEISPSAGYARAERNLDVRSLPLEENHFPDGAFDLVLASHLIEHLNNPSGFVEEVYRILAPGGYFIVTTPNISGFQARLFKGRWRSAIFDHLYLFSAKTLSRLLTEKGFSIERVRTWGGLAAGTAPAAVKRLADKTAKKFGFGDVMLIRGEKPTAAPAPMRPRRRVFSLRPRKPG